MTKIDIEKFICSIRRRFGENKYISTCLDSCLKDQGLRYIDKPEGGVLIRYMKEGKPIKVPKFRVGDKIRRKTPRRYDKDMQVTRIESNYYLCNHLGKFSSESISFSEESNYELVEQKPTDKVKPMFHKGEWIVFNGLTLYIREDKSFYGTTTKDGINNTYDYWDIDNVARLWTIENAKDGDVVVDKSDGTIGIFQSIGSHPDGGCYNDTSYCFLHCHCEDEFFYADFENGNEIDSDDLVPATKEQRDTLMKVMADAGYTFDFEKKELKKIDWNPQPGDIFRKKGTISPTYHLCDKREDGITFGFVENREVGIVGGEITIFTLRNDYELVERPKPMGKIIEEEFNKVVCPNNAWSEEDEHGFENCLYAIKETFKGVDNPHRVGTVDWLKSIKDRIQPRSQWKPSNDHIDALSKTLKYFRMFNAEGETIERLTDLCEQLKKLKE